MLQRTHAFVGETLFAIAYDDSATPQERLQRMNRKTKKLLMDDAIGCLMGVITVDAA